MNACVRIGCMEAGSGPVDEGGLTRKDGSNDGGALTKGGTLTIRACSVMAVMGNVGLLLRLLLADVVVMHSRGVQWERNVSAC